MNICPPPPIIYIPAPLAAGSIPARGLMSKIVYNHPLKIFVYEKRIKFELYIDRHIVDPNKIVAYIPS
jgi:hypothetical protein